MRLEDESFMVGKILGNGSLWARIAKPEAVQRSTPPGDTLTV
jgi:hypothetical protein